MYSTCVSIKVQRSSSVSPYLHIAPLLITSISIIDRKIIPCPLSKSSQHDKVLRELPMPFLYDQTNSERTTRRRCMRSYPPASSFSHISDSIDNRIHHHNLSPTYMDIAFQVVFHFFVLAKRTNDTSHSHQTHHPHHSQKFLWWHCCIFTTIYR